MDRSEGRWVRVGERMPKSIGFKIVLHPTYTDTIWVLLMDGTMVWPRTSPGRRPAAYIMRNAGKTWKRPAMSRDERDPAGLYFGYDRWGGLGSRNEGASWKCLVLHLPKIYSVEVVGVWLKRAGKRWPISRPLWIRRIPDFGSG